MRRATANRPRRGALSPTVFTEKGFRFLFFSREEPQMHVHVQGANGEAKFWLEPDIQLARASGLSERDLKAIERIIQERANELVSSWHRHFSG